ncbi:MAG: MFS transporter [Candidatus Binatia bacterium]
MTTYRRRLFALLCGVVVFEGFDASVTNLVVPYVGREFSAGPAELGAALSLVGLGAVLAFFTIRLGDRFGRRPVILWSVLGFSLCSLATTFTGDLRQFVILQFSARVCLVTQISTAYILLSEALPAAMRGRANGFMAAFASFGAALPAILLHPAEASAFGWRSLFVIGAAPLLLLPSLWLCIRESELYLVRQREAQHPPSIGEQLRTLTAPHVRVRFLTMSAVWFVISFWSAATGAFFTYYVLQERAWTTRDVQLVAPFALVFGFSGYALSGWLMDRIGRRHAAAILLLLATVVTMVGYYAMDFRVIAACWMSIQMLMGVWVVAHVINSELFATEVRAAANGLCENLLGRWGFVFGPGVVGWLAGPLGATGHAVIVLACINLLAIPLLLWVLPETRQVDLSRAGVEPLPR